MLDIEGLSIRLGDARWDAISFRVEAGEYFVLLGQSGAGKSVILETLAGLIRPVAGTIRLDGREITRAPIHRRGLGLVYQDHALFPHLSVRGNIAYARTGRPRRLADAALRRLAAEVGVEHLLSRRPGTLSEGEAQRVALARALAAEPRVLMLDEPLASLDVEARAGMRSLLRRLSRSGRTVLHVTHDYEEAIALASRIAVLEDGRISQHGTPEEVFHHPRSRFVAHFIGIRNFFRGDLRRGEGAAEFVAGGCRFHVTADAPDGPGSIIVRSEDVTLSPACPDGSARNVFRGTVVEVEPAPRGALVSVEAGVRLYALVTRESVARLGLRPGAEVWSSFKSTAVRFVPEHEEAGRR
jgi:molybdopterin-binding protein